MNSSDFFRAHWSRHLCCKALVDLRSSQLSSIVIPVPLSWTDLHCRYWGWWMSRILRIYRFIYHKRTRQMTSSIQPIACLYDQQAGHVTRRPTIASKNSSQGLPQQLSNLQLRRAIKEIQHTDSGKIALATVCRVYTDWYWLHSLVHLFSQTGYRVYRLVLAIQPCTLASTSGYSVPTGTGYTALYTCFNNWLQCTDWYWLHSRVHLLQQQLVTVY